VYKRQELKRQGKNLAGHCPFHNDRTPSLIVTPENNTWHCMGACNVGGSPIDWVMKAEGISFRHAAELLRAEPPALLENSPVVKVGTVRKLPPPVERDASDAEILDLSLIHISPYWNPGDELDQMCIRDRFFPG